MIAPRLRSLAPACLLLLLALVLALSAGRARGQDGAAERALVLDGRSAKVDLWDAARMRFDATGTRTLADMQADPRGFHPPPSDYPTFGVRSEILWVRVPLDVRCDADCPRVFDLEYTAIAHADVHLLADGVPVQHVALGNLRPFSERPLASRSHSAVLDLVPGARMELLVRLETRGAMIVPLTLNTPAAFHGHALDEQMLQGLLTGLGICLLLYSVAQGIGLRESLFLKYALMISGSILFSLLQFGIGAQYLWKDNLWVELHIGAMSALIASTGSFLFIEAVLAGPEVSRWFSRIMKGGAVLSAVLCVAYAADVIDTQAVSAIVSILGLVPVVMGLPGAVKRAFRGDQVGIAFLIAWAVYFLATAVMIMVINGRAPVNFWTMHSFQFGATIDMLLFMRVLGLRMKDIHTQARRVTQERDAMRSLAHTDALTGLPNRRGLHQALDAALARPEASGTVAVYMLDLDGFKPVNDRHGHDVGDELLVAVAGRLQANVRRGDIVARLGGDEFVVMAGSLPGEEAALQLGDALLDAFQAPFEIGPHTCRVGITIGYALSPADSTDGVTLLKYADAAMYLGKSSGKACIRRGGLAALREATAPPEPLAYPGAPH